MQKLQVCLDLLLLVGPFPPGEPTALPGAPPDAYRLLHAKTIEKIHGRPLFANGPGASSPQTTTSLRLSLPPLVLAFLLRLLLGLFLRLLLVEKPAPSSRAGPPSRAAL